MPREPRVYVEKVLYLVTAKSLDDRQLFLDPQDYTAYLTLLAELKRELGFKLYAYCLLSKRLCLLIELQKGVTISTIMHHLNSKYTKKYNSRYGKKGHLFQSRFKSVLVEKEKYLLRLTRYIHLLPSETDNVQKVSSYPFSSYFTYTYEDHQSHTGLQWPNIVHEINEVMHHVPKEDISDGRTNPYEHYVDTARSNEIKAVQKLLHRKAFVGSPEFIRMIQDRIEAHIKEEKKRRLIRKTNPAFFMAGSLVILFLIAAAYFLYSGQTQLQNALNATSNGFEMAREGLVQRMRNLETEITGYEEQKNFGLGGYAWKLEFRPVQDGATDEAFSDDLQFRDGKIVSAKLMAKGFAPFEYTISRKSHGKLVWQTSQTNAQGVTVRWYGIVTGKHMRGVLNESPANGKSRAFSFVTISDSQRNG